MRIDIFDIDGTLTNIDPELVKKAGYTTHAYSNLLTFHFVENKNVLEDEITEWQLHEKNLKNDFIDSSADMMQRALRHTAKDLTEKNIIKSCSYSQ